LTINVGHALAAARLVELAIVLALSIHPRQLKRGINDFVFFFLFSPFSFLFSLFFVVALPFPAFLSSLPGSHVRTVPPFPPAFPRQESIKEKGQASCS
jgi:hypothetical protein